MVHFDIKMDDNFHIPVIDFARFSLDLDEKDVSNGDIRKIADQICQAFRYTGFVYLKNHGITESKVGKCLYAVSI